MVGRVPVVSLAVPLTLSVLAGAARASHLEGAADVDTDANADADAGASRCWCSFLLVLAGDSDSVSSLVMLLTLSQRC